MVTRLLPAVTLAVLVPACGGGSSASRCGTCPGATYDLRALDDSSVTWTFRDMPAVTTTGFAPAPPPDDRCSFSFEKARYIGSLDAGGELWWQGYIYVRCGGGGHGVFDIDVTGLGDLRDWRVGTRSITAFDGDVTVLYQPDTATNGPAAAAATDCNVASLGGLVSAVTVETATGSGAPFPDLVSGDYRRVFRLDLDTSTVAPTLTGASHSPCTL